MGSMRFRFDGQPINESDTPAQVVVSLDFKLSLIRWPGVRTLDS